MKTLLLPIFNFWNKYPALLYGLALLLGCAFAFKPLSIYFFPCLIIYSPIFSKMPKFRILLAILFMIFGAFYSAGTLKFPHKPEKEFSGMALFKIDSFSRVSKHYGHSWLYKGTIQSFHFQNEVIAYNIPANIQLSSNLVPPKANRSYLIEGILREISPYKFVIIPNKDKPWIPIPWTFSFADFRYQAKQAVSNYIYKNYHSSHVAAFLVGIATGDFQDRLLSYEFSRFALQHIMAISGFHFAIVASLLNFILSIFFSPKKTAAILILLLTVYFSFLGWAPSIMRAWVSATLLLASTLFERKSSGLNSLGIGLMGILLLDPLACTSLGFQFSFASTAAILLVYSPIDKILQKLFPKRPLGVMIDMNSLNQHAYTFLNWSRAAISLTIAVNSVALPLTLYYFQKFPLMGLVHNLFFPFLVSISMIFLFFGSFVSFLIAPLGSLLHRMNEIYTQFVLNYTFNMPTTLDTYWRTSSISLNFIIMNLCILFIFGVLAISLCDRKHEHSEDWMLL